MTLRTIEQRRALVSESHEHVIATLNGHEAIIIGAALPFATVQQYPDGLSAEYAWDTVARVMDTNNGRFLLAH